MAKYSMVRLHRLTNRKLEKMQAILNRGLLTPMNKGEIVDRGMDALKEQTEAE